MTVTAHIDRLQIPEYMGYNNDDKSDITYEAPSMVNRRPTRSWKEKSGWLMVDKDKEGTQHHEWMIYLQEQHGVPVTAYDAVPSKSVIEFLCLNLQSRNYGTYCQLVRVWPGTLSIDCRSIILRHKYWASCNWRPHLMRSIWWRH